MKNNDIINKPQHYTQGTEPFQIIKESGQWEGYAYGNVIKYMQRYPHKGTPLLDLKKAHKYLSELIEYYEDKEEDMTKQEMTSFLDNEVTKNHVKKELTYYYTNVDRINFSEIEIEYIDDDLIKFAINHGSKNLTVHVKIDWKEFNANKTLNHIHRLKGKSNV